MSVSVSSQERAKAVAHAEKKRSGMSGLIRNLKGNSANLRRSKGEWQQHLVCCARCSQANDEVFKL